MSIDWAPAALWFLVCSYYGLIAGCIIANVSTSLTVAALIAAAVFSWWGYVALRLLLDDDWYPGRLL